MAAQELVLMTVLVADRKDYSLRQGSLRPVCCHVLLAEPRTVTLRRFAVSFQGVRSLAKIEKIVLQAALHGAPSQVEVEASSGAIMILYTALDILLSPRKASGGLHERSLARGDVQRWGRAVR